MMAPRAGWGWSTWLAVGVLAVLLLLAVLGPWAVGHDPEVPNYEATYLPLGSAGHWLGTDSLGRDTAARVLAGLRVSLWVAFAASLINFFVGVTWGAVAGWVGGVVDTLLMRLVEALQAVPSMLVVILLMVRLEPGMLTVVLAIGLTYWLTTARLVRAEVRSLRTLSYVEAARAMGAGSGRILLRHVLPNAGGTILVSLTMLVPEAIFTEAFLSYIGLGVPPPQASLGALAAEGAKALQSYPHLLAAPAAVLCILILALNVVAEGARRAGANRG